LDEIEKKNNELLGFEMDIIKVAEILDCKPESLELLQGEE
jgi:hypothetical protein